MTHVIIDSYDKRHELSSSEFLVLSWIATICKTKTDADTAKHWQLWGLECAANDMGIDMSLVYDIKINKRYTGYMNRNRLEVIDIFE